MLKKRMNNEFIIHYKSLLINSYSINLLSSIRALALVKMSISKNTMM